MEIKWASKRKTNERKIEIPTKKIQRMEKQLNEISIEFVSTKIVHWMVMKKKTS